MKTPGLSKNYEPKEVESKIYKLWEGSGFFNPDNLPGKRKKSYAVALPPPNITGELHMGHALNATIQDILIRKKRMEGFKTLWCPGTDHAGIATQNVVEKQLKKEGKTRFDLGKEKFLEKVWEWRKKYGHIILDQLKKLGVSCDWSRTRFTMDKEYRKAVEKAFLYYRKKGLLYKGERVVNWCPRCQTSLSDLELEHKEEKGNLWHIRYPLKEKGYITVATTRPETMLGDTAVAVNPSDKRYKNLVGKKAVLPLLNREIAIVADKAVDPGFGTGAVKVTPAHNFTDWEISLRHKLPLIKIIGQEGKMTKESKICQGLSIKECREKILEKLKEKGFLVKIEDYYSSLPVCYRCHSIVEPLPSEQWFLKMEELGKMAAKDVKSGKIKFIPKNFEKVYFNWLKNVKDWCVSRQIWWGHKIPLKGEEDVLDTWFSSALWPFAILGWPEKTKDLKTFYPTSVLSTARDIINMWVARMVFSGEEFIKKPPFEKVFIHPTVLTKDGKRMSKSLGTGINPLDLCEKYGADATRFGLSWQMTGVQDMHFAEDNIIMGKKFCNKIWNASRFVLMQLPPSLKGNSKIKPKPRILKENVKILKLLEKTSLEAEKEIEAFRFGKAARSLYDFFWHDFCDKYIEKSKKIIQDPETKKSEKEETQKVLLYTLSSSLKLLHPFIPFVTEEIYQNLPLKKGREKCLMVESWPK